MDAGQLALKKIAGVAVAAIGILFVGAMVFYRERVFFADASYILFNIINYKKFCIQEHRYGSFITQLVPYLGQKMHLPIRGIIIGYAISFNFFYLSVAAILLRLKQYFFVILMALYCFLFISDTYFWINNEIHQAVAWMFLLFGVTIYLGTKQANIIVTASSFIVLCFLAVFTHFVVIIPTLFLWFFLWFEKENWPFSKTTSMLLTFFLLVIVAVKYRLTMKQESYDSAHLKGIAHLSLSDIRHAFNTPVIRMFLYRCLVNYWSGVIVFLLGIFILVKNNEKKLLAWFIGTVIGYFIVMGITYREFDANLPLFHIESEWASIGIIIATPFVFKFLPQLKIQFAASLILLVFAIRLFYICHAIPEFNWRIHFQERVFAQMKRKGITKLALFDNIPDIREKYVLFWGAPYESMLISAMSGHTPQCTFSFVNKDNKQTIGDISNPHVFNTSFGTIPIADLNSSYFALDTVQAYRPMTYEDFMK